jgi:hypothetical protein
MIRIKHTGDFSKTTKFLQNAQKPLDIRSIIEQYAKAGVSALASATPLETGETANSWSYEIEINKGSSKIHFINTNIQNGVPIAIILQYGHGTRNGGWVEGRDYINPAIQPIFDNIANTVWREVTKL